MLGARTMLLGGVAALAIVAVFVTVKPEAFGQAAGEGPDAAHGEIVDGEGAVIGMVRVRESAAGLVFQIEASGLTPGPHGLHLHEVGDCSDPPRFESAGDHISSPGHEHGLFNPSGPHEGDLPNLFVAENGVAAADLETDRVELARGELPLLDEDGSALLIHAQADDYLTADGGGSDDRVACAALQPVAQTQ